MSSFCNNSSIEQQRRIAAANQLLLHAKDKKETSLKEETSLQFSMMRLLQG